LGNDAANDLDDFSDETQLFQAFPVVAPQSDRKLGPSDIRAPHETLKRLHNAEKRADDWMFQRDKAAGALLREQAMTSSLKHQLRKAVASADTVALQQRERAEDVELSAQLRYKRGQERLLAAESRLQELKRRHEETRTQCSLSLEEARLLLQNEKAHVASMNDILLCEQNATKRAQETLAEAEKAFQSRLKSRDDDIKAASADAERQMQQTLARSDAHLVSVRERCSAELDHMREQVKEAQLQARGRVELLQKLRCAAEMQAAENERASSARFKADSDSAQRFVKKSQQDAKALLQRAEDREQRTTEEIGRKMAAMEPIFSLAAERSREALRCEVAATQSLEQAAHTLGAHVATRQQYGLTLDQKVGAVLNGVLHPRHSAALAPSPRSLHLAGTS
jgi:hypothetical protein